MLGASSATPHRDGFWHRGLLPKHPLIGVPILFIELLVMIVPSSALPDLLLDYFHQSYSLSAISTGVADSLGGLAAFLLLPYFGSYSDRHGRKSVLLILSLLSFIPIFALTFWPYINLGVYIASRGIGKLSAFGVLFSCIADVSTAAHRSPMYSRLTGFGTIAMVAGPFISLELSTEWSFRACGIMATATIFYILIMPETLDADAVTAIGTDKTVPNLLQVQSGSTILASSPSTSPSPGTLQTPLLDSDDGSNSAQSPVGTEQSIQGFPDISLDPVSAAAATTHRPVSHLTITRNPCKLLVVAFRTPVFRRLALILFFSQLSQNGIHSCAQLFLKKHLHFTKNDNNWLLLVMGSWAVFLMVLVVPVAMRQVRLKSIILVALAADMCHQTMYLILPSYSYFEFIAFFQGLSFLSYPAAVGALSRCGEEQDQGYVLAMSAGIRSLTQAIAPLAFNGLLSYFTWSGAFAQYAGAPFIFGMICIAIAGVATIGMKERQPIVKHEPTNTGIVSDIVQRDA